MWWPGSPPVDREHLEAIDVQHTNDRVLAVSPGVPAPGFHDTVDPVHHPLKQPLVHCLGRGQEPLRRAASILASSRKAPGGPHLTPHSLPPEDLGTGVPGIAGLSCSVALLNELPAS